MEEQATPSCSSSWSPGASEERESGGEGGGEAEEGGRPFPSAKLGDVRILLFIPQPFLKPLCIVTIYTAAWR